MSNDPSTMLSVQDIAERLGVTAHRVNTLMRNGKMPFVRLGARRLGATVEQVDAYLSTVGTADAELDDDDVVMNAADIALHLHVSESTVLRLMRTNALPHFKLGDRRLLSTRAHVDAYVASRTVDPLGVVAAAAARRADTVDPS